MKECIRVLKEFHESLESTPASDSPEDLSISLVSESGIELFVQPGEDGSRILIACQLPRKDSLADETSLELLERSRILAFDHETALGYEPESNALMLLRTLFARTSETQDVAEACDTLFTLAEGICRDGVPVQDANKVGDLDENGDDVGSEQSELPHLNPDLKWA